MTTWHRNTDDRVPVRQTFSQLLPATGDAARRSNMHTPAQSQCVFHRTDGATYRSG